jgi:hypothetical protein
MMTYGSRGDIAPSFITSVLDDGEWSDSRPCCFTTGERVPVPLDRRLGGPQSRSGLCGLEHSIYSEWKAGEWFFPNILFIFFFIPSYFLVFHVSFQFSPFALSFYDVMKRYAS